jgi:hypothetical protein
MPRQVLERDGLKVRIDPIETGPNAVVEPQKVMEAAPVRAELGDSRHRLLSFHTEDNDEGDEPRTFEATVYDYTRRRTVVATGSLTDPSSVTVAETAAQPRPTDDEFGEAVEVLKRDGELSAAIDSGAVIPYRAMPPLLNVTAADGSVERTLNVGLFSESEAVRHRFVSVNMVRESVARDPSGAPRAHHADCGVPWSDPCPRGRRSGPVRVRVTQGDEQLWDLVVLRPRISSGSNGSGVELRGVHYRGTKVIRRAHVPILNVEYDRNANLNGCGPTYRDWQDEEACFIARGDDVQPGYRACDVPAKTIFESGRDGGNFRGVAFYIRSGQLFIVSELAAGWYRYVSEWRLHPNGVIRPRFGFNAVHNPCTCKPHHHHAYWRFDFDLDGQPATVQEFNDPALEGNDRRWHTIVRETRRRRRPSSERRWRIRNGASNGYKIVPGGGDGTADDYGIGDLWVLRKRRGQVDDSLGATKARIDGFVNGQSVEGKQLVVWYAGHFKHAPGVDGDHRVGPRLEPIGF